MTAEQHSIVLEGRLERDGRTSWLSATLLEKISDNIYLARITTPVRPTVGSRLRFGAGHETNACFLCFVDAVVVSTNGADHVIEFAMTGPVLDEMLDRFR